MKTAAVIVAGGNGTRLGLSTPKAFVTLCGRPLYEFSLEIFLNHPNISEVVLVVPEGSRCQSPTDKVQIVVGGRRRQDSVWNGLMALRDDVEGVLIHDAARPFVTSDLIDQLLAPLALGKNVITALPMTDTVKLADGGRIVKTVDRQLLWRAQTPQGFIFSQLKKAFQVAEREGWLATDESFLIEKWGGDVHWVEGDIQNFKITTPADFKLAEAILRSRL